MLCRYGDSAYDESVICSRTMLFPLESNIDTFRSLLVNTIDCLCELVKATVQAPSMKLVLHHICNTRGWLRLWS